MTDATDKIQEQIDKEGNYIDKHDAELKHWNSSTKALMEAFKAGKISKQRAMAMILEAKKEFKRLRVEKQELDARLKNIESVIKELEFMGVEQFNMLFSKELGKFNQDSQVAIRSSWL